MRLVEIAIKAVGWTAMAMVVLVIAVLVMLGACAPAPASAAPAERSASGDDRICAWGQDTVGCGLATRLPLVGPVVMSCAIARARVQGEVVLGLSCMLLP